MREFIQKNVIRISISIVFILIMIGAIFSFYNRYVMNESLIIQQRSEAVLEEFDRLQDQIRYMDISSRGYALIREPQFLFWKVKDAEKRNREIFHKLDSLFLLQNFQDPNYAKIKTAMHDYTKVFATMVSHLENGDTDSYLKMLAFDYGKVFYQTFEPFFVTISQKENGMMLEARDKYKRAIGLNNVLQTLLLILGLPTLLWILFKLNKDEKERAVLLLDLEKNNKKYLFDDGSSEGSGAREILENSIRNLQKASSFVNQISTGNYEASWEGLVPENMELNRDNLAGRLVFMRDEMKRVKEEDNRRIWTTQGLSEFSDLIRKHQNNLEELTFNALIYLVKYTRSQQGSLFILHDEGEAHLKMAACYAFDRRKFVEKSVTIGEGLLGQTFLEGQTLLLKSVPPGYISITSGLGHATPTCVVIVPLKHNEQVMALIELATFDEYAPYQVSFLERAGEFIASAISTAQQSEKNKLLMEQMQHQTEQMRAQEEELRQNLEELEATQEAMKRKSLDEDHKMVSGKDSYF